MVVLPLDLKLLSPSHRRGWVGKWAITMVVGRAENYANYIWAVRTEKKDGAFGFVSY